jgi:hypothetical protein
MSFGSFQLQYGGSSPACSSSTLGGSSPLGGSSLLGGSSPLGNHSSFPYNFTSGLRFLNFDPDHVADSRVEYGDYKSDQRSGQFNKTWDSWRALERFLEEEEITLLIKLQKVQVLSGKWRYVERKRYVCSQAGTGGQKVYEKKNPHWERKVDSKLTDCNCLLVVKTYHNVNTFHSPTDSCRNLQNPQELPGIPQF